MTSTLRYSLVVVLAVSGIAKLTSGTAIEGRMSNGAPIETLKRFPHHVTIEPNFDWHKGQRVCGGSILRENWILTSARCVQNSERLNLHIQRLYKYDTSESFTIVVNNNPSNVIVYPTGFDDIALVKLPVKLVFSNTIKPITILEAPLDQLKNKLAVLPGFDLSTVLNVTPRPKETDGLTYAMLSIVPNSVCLNEYRPNVFDEYLNLCAKGLGNNPNTPCKTDFGNGLVVDWPAEPRLAGIYSSASEDCHSGTPMIYLNVQKYKSWIDSVMLNN